MLHDLRRTAVTEMANLGMPPHVVEAVVNHAGGHKAAWPASTTAPPAYAAEKRQALQRWGDHVTALVAGEQAKVVPLRRGTA